jgi:hypothetical protein
MELLWANVSIRNGTVVLTADQAREIYQCKLALEKQNRGFKTRGQSVHVARLYRVSPKAVRDIWNHTTWKPITQQLWQYDEAFNNGQHSQPKPTASSHISQSTQIELQVISRFYILNQDANTMLDSA